MASMSSRTAWREATGVAFRMSDAPTEWRTCSLSARRTHRPSIGKMPAEHDQHEIAGMACERVPHVQQALILLEEDSALVGHGEREQPIGREEISARASSLCCTV